MPIHAICKKAMPVRNSSERKCERLNKHANEVPGKRNKGACSWKWSRCRRRIGADIVEFDIVAFELHLKG